MVPLLGKLKAVYINRIFHSGSYSVFPALNLNFVFNYCAFAQADTISLYYLTLLLNPSKQGVNIQNNKHSSW